MTRRDWESIMVAGAERMGSAPFGLAILHPGSGTVLTRNPAMTALGEHPLRVARATLDSLDSTDSYASWTEGALTTHVAHLHALRGTGSVVVVMATDFDNTFEIESLEESPTVPTSVFVLHDLDMTVVGLDQRVVEYGIDPESRIGTHGFLTTHPEDVVRVSPQLRAVVSGALHSATYALRIMGPAGAWTNVSLQLRRLHGDEPMVMVTAIPRDLRKPELDLSPLSDGEMDVIRAVLRGQRPARIAERRGVSVSTVRNQLAAAFKKLGVESQSDLRQRYAVTHDLVSGP